MTIEKSVFFTADEAKPDTSVRSRAIGSAPRLASKYGVLIVLALFIVLFSTLRPDTFATTGNFRAIVNSQAITLLLALVATIVLRLGDFDLSIAAVMTASLCLTAVLVTDGVPIWIAIGVVFLSGAVVGAVNGFLVVKIGVDSFVITLGSLTVMTGIAAAVTDGAQVINLPPGLISISRTLLFGLPVLTWYAWASVLVYWYVYERTPVGRYMLFIGGGRETARLAGLPVDRLRMLGFVTSSTLAALVGVLLAGSLGAADPGIGGQYLLGPFAAAFLGATVFKVGRFNAFGTVVGVYLLAVGINGLQLLGARTWAGNVFNGVALITAVTLAKLAGKSDRE